MEAKPLTKERRAEIESFERGGWWGTDLEDLYVFTRELLADAAYWREAVKNAKQFRIGYEPGSVVHLCPFCKCGDTPNATLHDQGCAWLLSKDV